MIKTPDCEIIMAFETDPMKAGALGQRKNHWSGAPLQAEVAKLHPDLMSLISEAREPADLAPYFNDWYARHDAELVEAQDKLEASLVDNWSKITKMVVGLTDDTEWGPQPVLLALSSIYPSTYWSGKYTIDLHYAMDNFERDMLHELMHLRTEAVLGNEWFREYELSGKQKAMFMELLAEVLLSRSSDELAQAARSPYPFFAHYKEHISKMANEDNFITIAKATAQAVSGHK